MKKKVVKKKINASRGKPKGVKVIKKKTAPKIRRIEKTSPAKPIGRVTHFYGHLKVAIVKFKKEVRVGARLRYRGATTDFTDTIKSMQFDHKPVKTAKKNKLIGIKVKSQVREGDLVFEEK